jgi:TolA-binding protein
MDHIKSGDRAAAADAFLDFMKAYPGSKYIKDAHYNAANSLEIIGRVEEANALFEQYVQKWPKDERSRALFFRIAGNYANVLELQKAIANYDALVRNFPDPDNQDAPAALYNSAFLSIGLGDHKAAALKFEEYAKKFPTQPDAEQVRFQAGQQWEQVSARSALEFYAEYLAAYSAKASANPDHLMEAYHRIAVLKEETGVRGASLDAAWDDVSQAYARLAPSGRVGPTGRNYAAHAAFRNLEARFAAFQVVKFTSNDDKNAELLTKTKQAELDAIIKDSTSVIETYQDFEYSSAALYVQGAAYFAYADMLFDAPPPKRFTEEMIQLYQEQIDTLRLPVEDKGKNRLTANLEKAKEAKRWSP